MKIYKEITKDSLFGGDLVCYQNRDGYRFSIDSVLLANFVLHWKAEAILDMGCGCGVLGLIVLYKNGDKVKAVEGIEYQESLVALARRNSRANKLESRLRVTHGNYAELQKFYKAEQFSHIICNPPFYTVGRGRSNKNEEAHLARHQVLAKTSDLARNVAYVLKNRGRVATIFPAECLTEFIENFSMYRIEPKIIRPVYSYPEAGFASLVLLEGSKNGGEGLKFLPPLYIYTLKDGEYSQEVQEMYDKENGGARHEC